MQKLSNFIKEKSDNIYYFAYGSNMYVPGFTKKYDTAKPVVFGYINNWDIKFDKISERWQLRAVADIMKSPDSKVFGILYSIDKTDIPFLSKQESGYEMINESAYSADGNVYNVFTYSVIEKTYFKDTYPDLHYITKIIQGLNIGYKIGPKPDGTLKIEFTDYVQHLKNFYKIAKTKE